MNDTPEYGNARLVVASNRGPISVKAVHNGDDEVDRGGGGLVSGMLAALQRRGDVVWVCAALNDAERSLARQTAFLFARLRMIPGPHRPALPGGPPPRGLRADSSPEAR